MQHLRVNILSQENVLLRDVDILPPDEGFDVLLPDVDVWIADWGHVRTGSFLFPLHRSLELTMPHFIELESGEA